MKQMRTKLLLFSSLVLILFSGSYSTNAQVKNPVKWVQTVKKLSGGKYELQMNATLEKGWHIYSQTTPEGGPVPTSFVFTKNPLVTITGPVKEIGKMETHFEKLFDVNVKQFSGQVNFVQTVTVKGNVKTNVTGTVEYMLCNDRECLPPAKKTFTFQLQ
jgi:thiol:disulfide interchange protein DsbD